MKVFASMGDLDKSLLNTEKAYKELCDFLTITKPSKVERAGIIQAFEFCFELFWKAFKKRAFSEGLTVGSPKQAIKAAFAMGIINDEPLWLKMIEDRNLTLHTYNESLSIEIYSRIRDIYSDEFGACLTRLSN